MKFESFITAVITAATREELAAAQIAADMAYHNEGAITTDQLVFINGIVDRRLPLLG